MSSPVHDRIELWGRGCSRLKKWAKIRLIRVPIVQFFLSALALGQLLQDKFVQILQFGKVAALAGGYMCPVYLSTISKSWGSAGGELLSWISGA
jgi:hypothetical protein